MVEILSRNQVFTEMDIDLLAIYCEAHAIHMQASAVLQDAGAAVTTAESGYEATGPWVTIRDKAWKTKQGIMVEFGMGPASRTRINASQTPRYGKKTQKSGLLG
jgi:P27 family predicted phage terminase small subunit